MEMTIFKLSDYSDMLNGDEGARERFQHFRDLSSEQFDMLVDLVEDSGDHDWR